MPKPPPAPEPDTGGEMLGVTAIASRWGTDQKIVRKHIADGTLAAIDISPEGSKRSTWRIKRADLVAFEQLRLTGPKPKRPRRRRKDPAVIEFY